MVEQSGKVGRGGSQLIRIMLLAQVRRIICFLRKFEGEGEPLCASYVLCCEISMLQVIL